MVEEAGGTVNDINEYKINNIDIRAASGVIYDEMLSTLEGF